MEFLDDFFASGFVGLTFFDGGSTKISFGLGSRFVFEFNFSSKFLADIVDSELKFSVFGCVFKFPSLPPCIFSNIRINKGTFLTFFSGNPPTLLVIFLGVSFGTLRFSDLAELFFGIFTNFHYFSFLFLFLLIFI